jgi:hypothetical protein
MTSQFGSYIFLFLILFLCAFVKVFYGFQFYSSNQIYDFCFFDDKNDFNVVFFLFIFYCSSWPFRQQKKVVFNSILQIEFMIFIFSIIIVGAAITTMIVIVLMVMLIVVLMVMLIIMMMLKNNNNYNDSYDDDDNGDAAIIDNNNNDNNYKNSNENNNIINNNNK